MNTKFTSLCTAVLLAATAWIQAEDTKPTAPAPKPASAEFERMKTLVGDWQGKSDMGQGPVDINISYRLIAAGSVLEERVFAGTPNEMVTMYYDEKGKLAMTHYCMLGNRPVMALKASDADSLTFDLDSCCTIDKKEAHMHGTTLRFIDADTIASSCKAYINGEQAPEKEMTLKRVKTVAAK